MEELMINYWSSDDDEEPNKFNQTKCDETHTLSKKAARRMERFEKRKQWKKNKRKIEQENRRVLRNSMKETHPATTKPTKAEMKQQISTKLDFIQASHTTPKICIDMGLGHLMTKKEIDSLSSQLRILYGSNRQATKPLHLTFSSLVAESPILDACHRRNDGFSKYQVHMTAETYLDIFPQEKITYLTPDSDTALDSLEVDRVYVIGGLVDESPNKEHTLRLAAKKGIPTARLPTTEYLKHGPSGSFNRILSVNQIFDILLRFHESGDWTTALMSGIPKRKGFIPK